jgi:G3E family GTPase
MSSLPVYLVTGFLGGGKTTLLQKLARDYPQKRMMFLVNELSGTDVDAHRLTEGGKETHAVVGGSIFCECKAADFLNMLRADVMPAHQAQPLDALIIETSGIADPSAIGTLIEKAGYGDELEVRQIVTILSPKSFTKLQGNLPVFDAQIEAADVILLNKIDLADEETIAQCKQTLTELNPKARLVECRYCEGIPFFENQRTEALPHAAFSKCSDLKFGNEVLKPEEFASLAELENAVRNLASDAYRIKGVLQAAGHFYQVDATPDGVSIVETQDRECGIVVIRSKGKTGLIACDVFQDEIEHIDGVPEDVVWLPMGLHDKPAELRKQLQQEIDRLEDNPEINKILFLYGLCGGGVEGLHTRRCQLILPRSHDCIGILLGSNQKHQEIQKADPHTYFFSPGWIRGGRVPGPQRESWLRALYADRYDEEMIDELVDMDTECFAMYKKALFIRSPAADHHEDTCRNCASFMNWSFEAVEGDTKWLSDFFAGKTDAKRFKVLNPNETLALSGDAEIFK